MKENGNILRHFSTWNGALVRLGRAHLQLMGSESKHALVHFGVIAAVAVGGLLCALFGYAFLCLTIVFGVAALMGEEGYASLWLILGAMAVVHVALAAAGIWVVLNRIKKPVFEQTVEELRKDQVWLTTKADAR